MLRTLDLRGRPFDPRTPLPRARFDVAAAAAVVAAMKKGKPRATYLVADDIPMTRRQICESARKHPTYRKQPMPKFDGDGSSPQKTCNTTWTRKQLKFQPRYTSFDSFITSVK